MSKELKEIEYRPTVEVRGRQNHKTINGVATVADLHDRLQRANVAKFNQVPQTHQFVNGLVALGLAKVIGIAPKKPNADGTKPRGKAPEVYEFTVGTGEGAE